MTTKAEIVPSKREAQVRLERRRSQAATLITKWWELMLALREDLHDGVPQALGMDANQYLLEAVGDRRSRSGFYRVRRIVEKLPEIPEDVLKQIPEPNAYELTRLPEDVRTQGKWIDMARRHRADDFKNKVEAALVESGQTKPEMMIPITDILPRRVPESLAEVMREAMGKAARVHGLDIETRAGDRISAVEAIFAEYL